MKFFLPLILGTSLWWLPAARAESPAGIGAPVMGFVFDGAAHVLRPITGSLGASRIGDALPVSFSLAQAVVSPAQNCAAAVDALSGATQIVALPDSAASPQPLPSAEPWPKQMVFSPAGAALALTGQYSARLQIFTGLPQRPALAYDIDTSGLGGDVLSAALSDDGQLALLLTSGGLWISQSGTSPVRLMDGPTAAISFQAGTHAAAAVASDGRIWIARDLANGAGFQAVSPEDSRLESATGVQFSADGAGVSVATRQGTLASLNFATGDSAFLACQCAPAGLFSLNSPMLFRLTNLSDMPLMLLDTATAQPRTWFVPALVRAARIERSRQ